MRPVPPASTYPAGGLFRLEVKAGRAGRLPPPPGHHQLKFPDAPRTLRTNSFLLVQGSGTLDRVVIQGDTFAVTHVRGGFATPTSVARIGTTAWVSEGQLAFFFDASKKTSSPSLPFRIYAVPLRKEDAE